MNRVDSINRGMEAVQAASASEGRVDIPSLKGKVSAE